MVDVVDGLVAFRVVGFEARRGKLTDFAWGG
jgi:hypothetical protein